MANTGKSEHTDAERKEYQDLVSALAVKTPAERKLTMLSPIETSVLLRVSIGTLDRARSKRKEHKANGQPIDPTSLASLPFSQQEKDGSVHYFAEHVQEYLGRLFSAAEDSPDKSPLPQLDLSGIRRWLAEAGPTETWPVTIRADGRPVDMMWAIVQGELTGVAERLTLRDFSARVADASAAAHHRGERNDISSAVRQTSTGSEHEASRWETPGGPI